MKLSLLHSYWKYVNPLCLWWSPLFHAFVALNTIWNDLFECLSYCERRDETIVNDNRSYFHLLPLKAILFTRIPSKEFPTVHLGTAGYSSLQCELTLYFCSIKNIVHGFHRELWHSIKPPSETAERSEAVGEKLDEHKQAMYSWNASDGNSFSRDIFIMKKKLEGCHCVTFWRMHLDRDTRGLRFINFRLLLTRLLLHLMYLALYFLSRWKIPSWSLQDGMQRSVREERGGFRSPTTRFDVKARKFSLKVKP